MSGVRVVSFPQRGYARILQFLYPTYSVTKSMSLCREFIVEHDVTSRQERDMLDMDYEDCVFISSRMFDELWTEEVIRREVLSCARSRFGSRKRQFTTVNTEGDAFIDECISFLFFGSVAEEEDSGVLSLFDTLGTAAFSKSFLEACSQQGSSLISASVGSFIQKVLKGGDSLYYRRARLRLGRILQGNIVPAVEAQRYVSDYFSSHFRDLSQLWFFTNLTKR